jgi:hypothetical protein
MRRIAKLPRAASFSRIVTFVVLFFAGNVLLLAPQAARAASLNIDFGSQFVAPSGGFAAAGNQPGFWNEITTPGVSSGLKDLSGATTGVVIDVVADTLGGFSGTSATTDVARLLNDNFYSFPQQPWRITLTGLADGLYDVYAYAPANPNVGTGGFTVNGIPVAAFPGASTLIEDASWKRISNVNVVAGSLILEGTDPTDFSGLSGLQLVPEPSTAITWALASIIVAAGRLARRSRRVSSPTGKRQSAQGRSVSSSTLCDKATASVGAGW